MVSFPKNDPKFWTASMIQGGDLGIVGDFLFSESNLTARCTTRPRAAMRGRTSSTMMATAKSFWKPSAKSLTDLTGCSNTHEQKLKAQC
jgi:hypothetical protein